MSDSGVRCIVERAVWLHGSDSGEMRLAGGTLRMTCRVSAGQRAGRGLSEVRVCAITGLGMCLSPGLLCERPLGP